MRSIRAPFVNSRAAIGIFWIALFVSVPNATAEDALVVQPQAWSSPASVAALRAFETRVRKVHAQEAARAGGRQATAEPQEGDPTSADPAEPEPRSVERRQQIGLRSVLDRMAASIRWEVEQDSWSAGVRLRYSRSVEFDPETASFALIEAIEIAPAASYRILAIARPMKVLVRRTGYAEWTDALFAAPSRWLFNRPNRIEEARRLAPGTEVLLSNEATFFIGPEFSEDIGSFPLEAHAGFFASGEYFVRVKRLAASEIEHPGTGEWILSAGGLIAHGAEAAIRARTPEILWHKRLQVFNVNWRLSKGIRFRVRAGPLDLNPGFDSEPFYQAILGGAAVFRFSDFRLLGKSLKVEWLDPQSGMDLVRELEQVSRLEDALSVARNKEQPIELLESVSSFAPRRHGSFGIGLWALVYGLTFGSDWNAEESVVLGPGPVSQSIYAFPLRERWDRGWVLFPRETRDFQLVTVQDSRSPELFTEVSLEIEDARAWVREDRAYRAQILRFLTATVAAEFRTSAAAAPPAGPVVLTEELPDLTRAAEGSQKVSIYLRLILGPRFHAALSPDGKGKKDREKQITAWQRELASAIRRGGDGLDALVRELGTQDLYVGFRIAFTPYERRKESPSPKVEYRGSFGDPDHIPSYRRLRAALDDAGTSF